MPKYEKRCLTCKVGGGRLVWALVHSKSQRKVKEGLDLAELRLGSNPRPPADEQRELVYYCAVAYYKRGRYIDARRQLEELLKVDSALSFLALQMMSIKLAMTSIH